MRFSRLDPRVLTLSATALLLAGLGPAAFLGGEPGAEHLRLPPGFPILGGAPEPSGFAHPRPGAQAWPHLAKSATNEVCFDGPSQVTVQEGRLLELPVRITRVSDEDEDVSVQVRTSSSLEGDFTLLAPPEGGRLLWLDADTSGRSVRISIQNHGDDEPDESFVVHLANATGALLCEPSAVQVTIEGDPKPPPTKVRLESITPQEVKEEAGSTVTLEVRLEDLQDQLVRASGCRVRWRVASGGARLATGDAGEGGQRLITGLADGTASVRAVLPEVEDTSRVVVRLLPPTAQTPGGGMYDCGDPGTLEFNLISQVEPANPLPPGIDCSEGSPLQEICDDFKPHDVLTAITPIAILAEPAYSAPRVQIGNLVQRMEARRLDRARSALGDFQITYEGHGDLLPARAREEDPDESLEGLFLSGTLTLGEGGGSRGERGFSLTSRGLTLGYDRFLKASTESNLVLGVALGLERGEMELEGGGELDSKGWSLCTYGTLFSHPRCREEARDPGDPSAGPCRGTRSRYLDWIAIHSRSSFDLRRPVEIPDKELRIARGRPSGEVSGFSLGLGRVSTYPIDGKRSLELDLFARFGFLRGWINSYVEEGAGVYNLIPGEQQLLSLTLDTGLRIAYDLTARQRLGLRLASVQELDPGGRHLEVGFAEDPDSGFLIPIGRADPSYFRLRLDWRAELGRRWQGEVSYGKNLEQSELTLETFSALLTCRF